MTGVLVLLVGLVAAVAVTRWAVASAGDASGASVVAVLGSTAAAFNIVVPVASIEATTTIVVCSALALGARTACAVAIVAVMGSSMAGGFGAWTLWQIVASVLVAILAANVPVAAPVSRTVLGLVAVVATVLYDVIVTAGGLASYVPVTGGTFANQLTAALLIGALFTVVHAVFTSIFTIAVGPSLLHALGRARRRLQPAR